MKRLYVVCLMMHKEAPSGTLMRLRSQFAVRSTGEQLIGESIEAAARDDPDFSLVKHMIFEIPEDMMREAIAEIDAERAKS